MRTKDSYKTWVLDFDGVILDSNPIKSLVFYEIALSFGKEYADMLLRYHELNGGISRYEKFSYFFKELCPQPDPQPFIEKALRQFSYLTMTKLLECREVCGLRKFLSKRPTGNKTYIVSGSDQDELRKIVGVRNLGKYFDGVFGSPRPKIQILREIREFDHPALFIGDSTADHEAARQFNMDFIFMYGFTGFRSWKNYCNKENLTAVRDFDSWL